MRNELTASEVQELHDRLARRLDGLMVPTLPHVACQVLRLVADPDTSLRDYGAVIKADQALTAKLIRMANSALYAQRNPATTIERAMVVLGVSRLKAMVLGFHLVNSGNKDALSKRRWSEAVLRGWLAHAITSAFDGRLAGEAFIIGLMIDTGLPLMSKLLGEKYNELVSADLPPGKAYAIESTRLPFTHADIASAMARQWNFPSSIAVPMARHHEPMSAPDLADSDQLLRGVAYYAGSIDLSADFDELNGDAERFLPSVANRIFKLSKERLAEIIQQTCAEYTATRSMFGDAIDRSFDVGQMLHQANKTLVAQVEELLLNTNRNDEESGSRTIEMGGRRIILSLVGPGRIRAVVTDREGKPLFIDEVMPLKQSGEDIRATLLLDDTPDDEYQTVLGQLKALAA